MNDLITIDLEKTNALELFVPEKVDDFLSKVEKEVLSFEGDISTDKGRKEIASFAYKIAKLKTKFDDLGKELVSDWKEKSKLVDAERKKGRDKLDELKDLARKPLTDFENAEKERISNHENNILVIANLAVFEEKPSLETIKSRLVKLDDFKLETFEEFKTRATETKEISELKLNKILADTEKEEAEKAELERLRKAEEERKQKEREEQIRQESEAKAKAELEAEKKRAEIEKQQALEAERKRVADEQAKAKAELEAREKDKNHKAKIHNEALVGLVALGLSEEVAKNIVKAIALNQISNIKIVY